MKILIFTEGTILMHKNAGGRTREEIVQQVKNKEESVRDYVSYMPIGDAPEKITQWIAEGNEIIYLTSRRNREEIASIKNVLEKYNFPHGNLEHRANEESYTDVIRRIGPDVIVEDNCESIGGQNEMIYPNLDKESQKRIKSVVLQEFTGIEKLVKI